MIAEMDYQDLGYIACLNDASNKVIDCVLKHQNDESVEYIWSPRGGYYKHTCHVCKMFWYTKGRGFCE